MGKKSIVNEQGTPVKFARCHTTTDLSESPFTRKLVAAHHTNSECTQEQQVKRIRAAAHHVPVPIVAKENSFHTKICQQGFPEKHATRNSKRMSFGDGDSASTCSQRPKEYHERRHSFGEAAALNRDDFVGAAALLKADAKEVPLPRPSSSRFKFRPQSSGNILV